MATTELIVAGLLPEIASDLQVSVPQTGLLVSVFALGMTIGAPVVALLTLRLPRRMILLLALALFTVAHVVIGFSDSFAVIVVCRFLTAVATGAFWSVAAVVATRLADPSISSRALTVAFGGGTLANVLGGPLGSFVGQVIGWRGTFLSVAVLAVGHTPSPDAPA
jgi:DHA1 family inner membrane transport protein